MKRTALALLLLGISARYSWRAAPTWAQADVWNAHLLMLVVALLAVMAAAYMAFRAVVAVCVYLALVFAASAACSLAWLVRAWPVSPGQDQCDARLDLPLSVMGLAVGLVLLLTIRSDRRGQDPHP